eukprot:2840028-Prymnesium_polylepis.2
MHTHPGADSEGVATCKRCRVVNFNLTSQNAETPQQPQPRSTHSHRHTSLTEADAHSVPSLVSRL